MTRSMKQGCAAVLSLFFISLSVPVVAAQDDTAAQERQQAMLDFRYADDSRCFIINNDSVRPVLPLLVASAGLPGIKREQVMAGLDDALERGCDIHQPDVNGLTALNTAILQGDVALSSYLLKHGADPTQIIDSPKQSINGLDSLGLLTLAASRSKNPQVDWQALRRLLQPAAQ